MEGCGTWLFFTGCNCVVDGKLLVELVRTSILELTTTGIKEQIFSHAYKKVGV